MRGGAVPLPPQHVYNRLLRVDVPQLNLLLLTLTSLTSWHCWWLWGLLPSFLSTTCLLSILAAEPHGGFTRRLQSHFHLCALLL